MRYSTSSEKQNHAKPISNQKSTIASIFSVLGTKQDEDIESGQDFHAFNSIENLAMKSTTCRSFLKQKNAFEILSQSMMKKPLKVNQAKYCQR